MHRYFRFAFACATSTLARHAPAQTIDAYDPSPGSPPTSLALQADGRVVLVGNFLEIGTTPVTRVARLDVDGSLDPTFADPNVDGEVKTVAVQADGKLLIGGVFAHVGGQPRHNLARLEADGALDAGFADPGFDSAVWAIAVQPDGRILAGGDFAHIGSVAQNYFARLEANGSLDSGFPDPQLCCNVVRAVGLQPNGDVLIGGNFTEAGGVDGHSYLARFSSSGVFDPSFPNVPDNVVLFANDMLVMPDGSLLLTASSSPSLRKLHVDGTLDGSFSAVGVDGSVYCVALQPNGKILIGGTFGQVGGQSRHGLARLAADGSLDASFVDLGFSFDATNPNGSVYGIAAQADGDVVAIGNFTRVGAASRQYAARVVTGNHVQNVLGVQATGSSVTVTWYRGGDGAELAQPPQLLHSTNGIDFSAAATMTRIAGGWQATANFDVHGARFWLQAEGITSGGALNGSPGAVASAVYSSDTIFANEFE